MSCRRITGPRTLGRSRFAEAEVLVSVDFDAGMPPASKLRLCTSRVISAGSLTGRTWHDRAGIIRQACGTSHPRTATDASAVTRGHGVRCTRPPVTGIARPTSDSRGGWTVSCQT
jgi:hypothetical protein